MAELAPVVRDHPVTRLAEPGWDAWVELASAETLIVAYADKRAGQRLETMTQRFASWRRRYPNGSGEDATRARAGDVPPTGRGWDDEIAALVEARARRLEHEVCLAAGVTPDAVRRLPWARRALREAAR